MITRCNLILLLLCSLTAALWGDGKMVAPRPRPEQKYAGSIEERAQEAIIIFNQSESGSATEDMILKVSVEGDVKEFGWIIPFPQEPTVKQESGELFNELFRYVEARLVRGSGYASKKGENDGAKAAEARPSAPVEVLKREVVGSYDVAVVRENEAGALNKWLEEEGFQSLEDGEDVISFYREKGYVFACMKVADAGLAKGKVVDLHPLRFSFKTGGRDGIYFPMRMTGLQTVPFDVNLYVFYGKWLNDTKSKFGYVHRGFELKYRDWDTRSCEANAGKSWSAPDRDPFLSSLAHRIPTVAKLFQKLHPGEKYYLTNIRARQLKPQDVRQWSDDLWLFPYYTDPDMVPYDVRGKGPASGAWPQYASLAADAPGGKGDGNGPLIQTPAGGNLFVPFLLLGVGAILVLAIAFAVITRKRRSQGNDA